MSFSGADRRHYAIDATEIEATDHPEVVPGWRLRLRDVSSGQVVRERWETDETRARSLAQMWIRQARLPEGLHLRLFGELPRGVVDVLNGTEHPRPPVRLLPEECAVVAVCHDGTFAALLSICCEETAQQVSYSASVAQYTVDGGVWKSSGAFWTVWPLTYGSRPDEITWLSAGGGMGGEFCVGIAPAGVDHVAHPGNAHGPAARVDPVTGAFLMPGLGPLRMINHPEQ
jgi:hypothetical protein